MGINNETVNKIIKALDSKKATDIKALYVGDITTITDYFVIATANSPLQAQAFADNLEEKITIITGDVKKYKDFCEEGIYDNVTVNPPYKVENTGFTNEDDCVKAARHEILMNLSDCVKAAEYSLKFGGKLAMVNRIDRLSDVMFEFKKNKIEPKRLCFITNDITKKPKIFLIEGIKGGKSGMVVEPFSIYI